MKRIYSFFRIHLKKTTNPLHFLMLKRSGLYFRWHRFPHHRAIHKGSFGLYLFTVLVFLTYQLFPATIVASQASSITKTSTADFDLGTNSNVSTASDELKLSTTYSSWYNASWKYRRKITIDYTKVSADQTDFPVLVKITGAIDPIFANAQADGDDILFTSSNETSKLSHEIEKFDTTGKELWAWVKVPALSNSSDTVLFMYYGNPDAIAQSSPQEVWDNNFKAVWHLKESGTPGTWYDSTSTGNNGTNSGVVSTTGNSDGGSSFTASSSQFIKAGNALVNTTNFTFSAYTKITSAPNNLPFYDSRFTNSSYNAGFAAGSVFYVASATGKLTFYDSARGINLTGTNTSIVDSKWHHVAVIVNDKVATMYMDGASVGTLTGSTSSSSAGYVGVGKAPDPVYFNGLLDEIKFSNTNRSATWISTEYNNQNNPEGFAVVGDEQASYARWYNASWNYRKPVTIDKTKVSTVNGVGLTDFPIMVNLTSDTDLAADALDNGYDLLFTLGDGKTKLSHEIESFSGSTGALVAWVKMPVLAKAENKVIYLYYGNSGAANQQNKTDVWSNGYAGVWHLGESVSPAVDSTSSGYSGSSVGTVTFGSTGKIGTSISQGDATENYINLGYILNADVPVTLSAWAKTTDTKAQGIFSKWCNDAGGACNSYQNYTLYYGANLNPNASYNATNGTDNGINATSNVSSDAWHYSVSTATNGTNNMKIYVDGAYNNQGTASGTLMNTANLDKLVIGNLAIGEATNYTWDGSIDEVRMSTVIRSADWVATEYNNQNSPATFYELGNEELGAGKYSSPTSTAGGSGILDTYYNLGWGTPNGFAATVTIPANTSIIFSARSSAVGGTSDGDWTGWQALGTASSTGTFSVTHDNMPVGLTTGANHYLQLKASLSTTDGLNTPTLSDFTFYYIADVDDPTNPTTTTATLGGNPLTSGTWTNTAGTVNFTFSGATDSETGVAGYYTYLGTSAVGDPSTYQAHVGAGGDNQTFSGAIADGGTYYFRIKTKDGASNISDAVTLFEIGCDTTLPTNPAFVSASPSGFTTTNSYTFSWPAGSDTGGSGLKWYEYKRATDVSWSHTANSSITSVSAIEAYQQGINVFYLRSVDNAGSTGSSYVQVTYYWSGTAPAKPDNLAVTPGTNDENSFTISWDKPAVGEGEPPIVGYYYSINATPTLSNTTYVASTASSVSVGPDHYATQQGENTVYVLSVDQAGNKSYESAFVNSATFNCQTTAPPIPTSVAIADSSNKALNIWALTVTWSAGVGHNALTFDHYKIERSINGTDYSALSTTTSLGYIDTENLNNSTTYYYRVYEVDNANKESAVSSVVSYLPKGNYTTPPTLLNVPTIVVRANQATISWLTDRASTSFVRFGTSANNLLESKGSVNLVTSHEVTLNGLSGSTTYYIQVQSVDENRDYTLESAYSTTYSFITLAAPAISNVSVSNIRLTSADISFETTTVAGSKVDYGTSVSYGTTIDDTSSVAATTHQIKFTNLSDSTLYHFKITATDVDGNVLTSDDYSFETLPLPKIISPSVKAVTGMATQTAKIIWESNVPITSVVKLKTTGAEDREIVKAKLDTDHEIIAENLLDSSNYSIIISGRDQFGNLAEAENISYQTENDKRLPIISSTRAESSNVGINKVESSQVIVYWKTDELSNSLVEYGYGVAGEYTEMSVMNPDYATEHKVIISAKPNTVFHLRINSSDKAGNTAKSDDIMVVSGESQKSVLTILLQILNRIFGVFGGIK